MQIRNGFLTSGKSVYYLGPRGSFTNLAALQFFGEHAELVPMELDEMFKAYTKNEVENICVAAMTSLVGTVNYNIEVIAGIENALIVGEQPLYITYCLLAKPGANLKKIKTIIAHPVALEEGKRWIDRNLANVERKTADSNSGAAKIVSEGTSLEIAALGSEVCAEIYGLDILATDIEKGPHNVTLFWILGRKMPSPTGDDKTTLFVKLDNTEINEILIGLVEHKIKILQIYERPTKKALGSHLYFFDVKGHSKETSLNITLTKFPKVKVLGSYPRQY